MSRMPRRHRSQYLGSEHHANQMAIENPDPCRVMILGIRACAIAAEANRMYSGISAEVGKEDLIGVVLILTPS